MLLNFKLKSYWQNKSVLITGAASGLSRALVEVLAPYQINFCLLSRRFEQMNELAEKLHDSGSYFWLRACDVRNRDEVYSAIKDFYYENGKLDIAWINSGIGGNSAFKK